jgi:hypothetical protein
MPDKHSAHYPPFGMRLGEAAAYLGMGCTKFLELVSDGRLPKPLRIDRIFGGGLTSKPP